MQSNLTFVWWGYQERIQSSTLENDFIRNLEQFNSLKSVQANPRKPTTKNSTLHGPILVFTLKCRLCKPPGAGECPGIRAALHPAGESPARAGAAAVEPLRASAGGGGLLCPVGHPQGPAGGRVQQPPQRPGWAGERPDYLWARQTGKALSLYIFTAGEAHHVVSLIEDKNPWKRLQHLDSNMLREKKWKTLCFKHLVLL